MYAAADPVARKVSFPPAAPDYTASYQATINTNLGPITLNLLNSKATCTVNSFVHLAEAGYFNNTQCHRLLTTGIYVLQCGDPYATSTTKVNCRIPARSGTGGPGYDFASENLTNATYPAGTLAMANGGTATSNGSQFFIVYKDSTSGLRSHLYALRHGFIRAGYRPECGKGWNLVHIFRGRRRRTEGEGHHRQRDDQESLTS